MKRSKSYRSAAEKIDADKAYAPLDAIRLAKSTASATARNSRSRSSIDSPSANSVIGRPSTYSMANHGRPSGATPPS